MKLDKNISKEPIFIVGFPRSGTTLLAAMLAANSRLSCGPETRFFRFLEKQDPATLLADWPDRAVDFLFSILLQNIPVPEHFNLDRNHIRAYLSNNKPSIHVILSSLTKQVMLREGKQRWVEKSPEHLMYVHEIRKYFPEAKIIRILRDPRDAALSMIKTPWAGKDYLQAILHWRKYDDISAIFFEKDSQSMSIYYEELIESPEFVLQGICSFLGEEFEEEMLNTSKSAGSVVTTYEPWKNSVQRPVDRSRLFVWKRELTAEQNRITEALIGDRLRFYHYDLIEEFKESAEVYPSIYKILDYRPLLNNLLIKDVRFWRNVQSEKDRITIFLGEPDHDGWITYQKPKRWYEALVMILNIMLKKSRNERIYWIRPGNCAFEKGVIQTIFSFLFRYTAIQIRIHT